MLNLLNDRIPNPSFSSVFQAVAVDEHGMEQMTLVRDTKGLDRLQGTVPTRGFQLSENPEKLHHIKARFQ